MTDWSRRAVVAIFVGLTLLFFWRPLSGQWSPLPNDLLDNAAPWSSETHPRAGREPVALRHDRCPQPLRRAQQGCTIG